MAGRRRVKFGVEALGNASYFKVIHCWLPPPPQKKKSEFSILYDFVCNCQLMCASL